MAKKKKKLSGLWLTVPEYYIQRKKDEFLKEKKKKKKVNLLLTEGEMNPEEAKINRTLQLLNIIYLPQIMFYHVNQIGS